MYQTEMKLQYTLYLKKKTLLFNKFGLYDNIY